MKKILNVLYWFILIVALLAVIANAGRPVQAQTISNPALTYESTWTAINSGQLMNFTHGFGSLPSTLNVWVALRVSGINGVYASAVPYKDYLNECLKVSTVNLTDIILRNTCDTQLIVRVDATLFNP
jgi:hypothetical protein